MRHRGPFRDQELDRLVDPQPWPRRRPRCRSPSRTGNSIRNGGSGTPLAGASVRTWFSGAPETVDKARAICGGCPVRDECYQYAISDPDLQGVWAGFTEKERRELRRELRRTRVA